MRNLVPRYRCFSLSDFKEFERCVFSFLVKHHLGKKYELEDQATPNQVIGSLLDLTIKKVHESKSYNQPIEFLAGIVKAAEREMRDLVERSGKQSFYGPQVELLSADLLKSAQEVFKNYFQELSGKLQVGLSTKTFWDLNIPSEDGIIKLWGGADALELGKDGVPEVVDYKFYANRENSLSKLDVDTTAKVYILLAASQLQSLGYTQARFRIRLWNQPLDDTVFREFDLESVGSFIDYFKNKAENILRYKEVTFCDQGYCRACKSDLRQQWESQIKLEPWLSR